MAWTKEQVADVAELLSTFCGADEVCAVTVCAPEDLDANTMAAFGCTFEQAKSVFAAQGRATLRRQLMDEATSGNMKALEMLAREQLGMGAVEVRAKHIAKDGEEDDAGEDAFLAAIIGNSVGSAIAPE